METEIKVRIRREGWVQGGSAIVTRIRTAEELQRVENEAKSADICLRCPLKECHPYYCKRYASEARKRGVT